MCLGATRTIRSPRSIRNRSSGARHVPAVLDRPHPLCVERSRPAQQLAEAAVARRHGQLPARCGGSASTAPPCASACAGPSRSRSSMPSLRLDELTKRTPADISQSGRMPRSLSVQGSRRKPRGLTGLMSVDGCRVAGGAWARSVVLMVCARALSLISVLDPGLLWVGDMMVGGVIPLGEALRPLGL